MAEKRIRVDNDGHFLSSGQKIELWDMEAGRTDWVVSRYEEDPDAIWKVQTDEGNEAWPHTRILVVVESI